MDQPKKRIAVVDVDVSFAELVLEFVADRYDIELTDDPAADYVIHSVKGYDVLKYSGVRLFIGGGERLPELRDL